MSKALTIFLSLLLVVGLGYGIFRLVNRFVGANHQLTEMVELMSELQTAHVSWTLGRPPRLEDQRFLFGDIRGEGVLDLRVPAQVGYDIALDVASTPGAGGERATVLARQQLGKSHVQVEQGPAFLLQLLETQGVPVESWVLIEGTEDVLQLLGETIAWPEFTTQQQVTLRTLIRETSWLKDPKATLTEIVHGRVTRLFTAELDAEALVEFERSWFVAREEREPRSEEQAVFEEHRLLWEGARVNLWVDQSSNELRRLVIQFGTGDQLDLEFEQINADVRIEAPEDEALPVSTDRDEAVDVPESVSTSSAPEDPRLFPTTGDRDGDGLTDDLEGFYGSNPNIPDTDGDGFLDGEEVKNGYSPTGSGSLFNFGLPTP